MDPENVVRLCPPDVDKQHQATRNDKPDVAGHSELRCFSLGCSFTSQEAGFDSRPGSSSAVASGHATTPSTVESLIAGGFGAPHV